MRLAGIVLTLMFASSLAACSEPVAPIDVPLEKEEPAPVSTPEAPAAFHVVLTSSGPQKIHAVKVVREVTGLSLKDSLGLVDGAPSVIGEDLTEAAAAEMAGALAESGATVEIRAGPPPEPVAEAATSFSVVLTRTGSTKISVIKAVRQFTGLGLKDAKGLVDGAPSVIGEHLSQAAAAEMAAALEEAGADVEIRGEARAAEAPIAATSFSVVITSVAERKIPTIRVVREVTGLGLKACKDLVDAPPSVIGKGLPKAAADELAARLRDSGVTVEIRPD